MITVCHHLASLMMPNSDPRDRFSYPILTLMIDFYIAIHEVCVSRPIYKCSLYSRERQCVFLSFRMCLSYALTPGLPRSSPLHVIHPRGHYSEVVIHLYKCSLYSRERQCVFPSFRMCLSYALMPGLPRSSPLHVIRHQSQQLRGRGTSLQVFSLF